MRIYVMSYTMWCRLKWKWYSPVTKMSAFSEVSSWMEMSGKEASRVVTKCPNQSNLFDSTRDCSARNRSERSRVKSPTVPPVARFKCFRFLGLLRDFCWTCSNQFTIFALDFGKVCCHYNTRFIWTGVKTLRSSFLNETNSESWGGVWDSMAGQGYGVEHEITY